MTTPTFAASTIEHETGTYLLGMADTVESLATDPSIGNIERRLIDLIDEIQTIRY